MSLVEQQIWAERRLKELRSDQLLAAIDKTGNPSDFNSDIHHMEAICETLQKLSELCVFFKLLAWVPDSYDTTNNSHR